MSELHPEILASIDLAAREVAAAFYERHGGDVVSLRRLFSGFLGMAVTKAAGSNQAAGGWTCDLPGWTTTAADPQVGLDDEAFARAVNKWWDSLDEAGQLNAVMQHAGHHKSEYVNNILQKYKDKPESILLRDIPDLDALYRQELQAPMMPGPKL